MRRCSSLLYACWLGFACYGFPVGAVQIDIAGPPGSGEFGRTVTVLPNGNFVVTDPSYDVPGVANVGAVHLYDSVKLTRISTLIGSKASDQVGSGGVTVLSNGNFVVRSPAWDNGAIISAGAVTWGSATTGVTGVVSAANSLIGGATSDIIGSGGIFPLPNGHYLVSSGSWNNGAVADAGAVTWANGATGITGLVSAANSLVGTSADDQVGNAGVTVLANGHYVVRSALWDNGPVVNAGAVTWGNGDTGVTGAVSVANSLVGGLGNDQVGNGGITALPNGNYVVRSTAWDNGAEVNAGAVTWGNGTNGVTGEVSAANSLIGSTASDQVGNGGVTVLANGHYAVRSTVWDRGALVNVGAVTWGSGASGVSGEITAANSLIGSAASDQIGSAGIITLPNGHYLVLSPGWDLGLEVNAGAVTWGAGDTGVSGEVTVANSLIGPTANDQVGSGGVIVLNNGNYVVSSGGWDDGATTNMGAVTWGSGATGIAGPVSAFNSLVGSAANDQIGSGGIIPLNSGNYVVVSPLWDSGATVNVGAVTWGSGVGGTVGAVSAANSLIGGTANDQIGSGGLTALNNGNFVATSPLWDHGTVINAGSVTWGNGAAGVSGVVSPVNSLVGSSPNDQVGNKGVCALSNGNYVVSCPNWRNETVDNAGAVTWGSGASGTSGAISAANSLVGSTVNDTVGNYGVFALSNGHYVVVSLSWDNGAAVNAGAVTWGNGASGANGAISAGNSLVGGTPNDLVGFGGVTILSNGNYVVSSPLWDNGTGVDAGAVTWGSGTNGATGVVSAVNSLVGSVAGDTLGNNSVTALNDGNYMVNSPAWDNGPIANAGAITLGLGAGVTSGLVRQSNSVLGNVSGGGSSMNFSYDSQYPIPRLLVGYPSDNRVSIFSYSWVVLTSPTHTNGQFQFTVIGPTGPNYVITASTNLVNWQDVATNVSPVVPFQFTDANLPGEHRFYRARLQP